jgi:hypothetical protein
MVARANTTQPLDANLYRTFNSVVKVTLPNGYGSGAHLKGTNYILTSAHVAYGATTSTTVTFSTLGATVTTSADAVYVHPLYKPDGTTPEYDIALIKFSGSAPTWSPGYEIQADPVVYGQDVWIAGFGQQSIGGSIPQSPWMIQKSWATNVTDFVTREAGDISPLDWDERALELSSVYAETLVFNKAKNLVLLDYDDGTESRNAFIFKAEPDGTERYGLLGVGGEGIPLPGDSGGPIINMRNEKIIGVTTAGARSYADPDWSRPGNFGEISLNASPRQFSGWIKSITEGRTFKESSSFEKIINYSPQFNSYNGSSNSQKFRIDVSSDYDSTTIFAKSKDEFYVDTGDEYIRVKGIPTINIRFTENSFGNDIFFDIPTGKLKLIDQIKTPIPQTFDFYFQGTIASETVRDMQNSNQKLQGGGGSDIFIVSSALAEYDLEKQGNQIFLRRYPNAEVDVLVDFEKLYFSDNKVVSFNYDQQAGKALRVYKAAFGRNPTISDQVGLGFWVTKMEQGMDQLDVAARFVDSPEFRSLYGTNPSNAEFLTRLYQNVLGRAPEATGYNWWLNELNTNPTKTKSKALADFSESPENQAGVAKLIGNGITYEPWVG